MPSSFFNQYKNQIEKFIDQGLAEDLGAGDHSSLSCIDADDVSRAQLLVKENGLLAGVEIAKEIFKRYDPKLDIQLFLKEGSKIKAGDIAFSIQGPTQSILSTERLVLNTLQRMSGIATFTQELTQLIQHTSCKLLDTRKTTPNFRYPEKWAVLIGGGYNHRMGLFDSIIIKDTHIDSCGSISKVLEKTKKYIISKDLKIPVIVETRNINEIKECLKFDWIDRILLDNMNVNQIKNALKLINNKIKTEASGNISSKNIVEIAETGVDYISVGALTHSYKSIDFSMKVI